MVMRKNMYAIIAIVLVVVIVAGVFSRFLSLKSFTFRH